MLRSLANETGETATLEVPVEDSMLILDEVTGRHVVGAAGNVGTIWPDGWPPCAGPSARTTGFDWPWRTISQNCASTCSITPAAPWD